MSTTVPHEHCPGCLGVRVPESLDLLPRFEHTLPSCAIVVAERATLVQDRARHERRGTVAWHRPATPTERALVRAAGVHVEPRAPLFARVVWDGDVRQRTFARAGVGALDAAQVAHADVTS